MYDHSSKRHRLCGRLSVIRRRRLMFEAFEERCVLAAGDLDPTFGGDGIVFTELMAHRFSEEHAQSVAIQPDGKILAAGRGGEQGYYQSVLLNTGEIVRYTTAGVLDPTFGGSGIVLCVFPITEIAVQSDGKIVAAGSITNGPYTAYELPRFNFALARFNSDGSLDTTFGGGDGIVKTPIGTSDDRVSALKIQSDGKIVIAGTSKNGSALDFALARYDSNGSLDTTFDDDGIVTTAIGTKDQYLAGLAIQTDGKIVTAGHFNNGSNVDYALFRYDSNGSLDTTFSTDGQVTSFGESIDRVFGLAIQTDGKIVTLGDSNLNSIYSSQLVRYNSDGSLDTTFDGDGTLTFTSLSFASEIAILNDGKIVVAGYYQLIRFNSNGALDTTFGNNGSSNAVSLRIASIAIQNDDKIVAVGSIPAKYYSDFAIARFSSNGALDTAFETDGLASINIGANSHDSISAVAIQSDGRIVAAGYTVNGDSYDYHQRGGDIDSALTRYLPDGTLDLTFNGDGRVVTDLESGKANYLYSVAIQSDGKIVVAGRSSSLMALARYDSNGSLDTTFGSNGIVTTAITGEITSLVIQNDGKIVAGGFSGNLYVYNFELVRFNADGSLDTTFGGDGSVTTQITNQRTSMIKGLAIQSDGKIVAIGDTDGPNNRFALARYDTNGALDQSFDGDGIVLTSLAGASALTASSIAIQSDGKIVAAGYASIGEQDSDFALTRYNTNGSLDRTFDGDGILTTSFSAYGDRANGVAIDRNGKGTAASQMRNRLDFNIGENIVGSYQSRSSKPPLGTESRRCRILQPTNEIA